MFIPQVEENINTREMISQWRGYNHHYAISMGEFYDMDNMTCDDFPIMTARDIRPTLLNAVHGFRGMLYTDSKLCYLDGNTFHYGSWMIDLSDLVDGTAQEVVWDENFVDEPDAEPIIWTEQNLIRYGMYILIMGGASPMNVWVKLSSSAEERKAGVITNSFESGTGLKVLYSLSKQDGSDYENLTVSGTAPVSPNEGDYWLNNTEGEVGLNVYLNSSWQPVASCYIRIEIQEKNQSDQWETIDSGFDELFRVDDVVFMNSATVSDINDGSVLQAVTSEYIVVIGIMDSATKDETTSTGYRFKIDMKIPRLDYVCADKNRVWGCHYGMSAAGEQINEIYCSKLGDFRNWYSYQGLSTDSYSATIGVPGQFTGCISFGNYPVFFKESCIIRIFGNYPAEYNVDVKDARGVQAGSHKSLAIVGESLFYKAPGSIMVYDGSLPRSISDALGRDSYYDGVAGVCGSKYFIEMSNTMGGHRLFVFDSEIGLWTKESHLGLLGFSGANDGRLFGFTNNDVFGFGIPDNELYLNKKVSEEYVSWFVESGDMGLDIPEFKRVNKFTLRAFIPSLSEVMMDISYDDKPFEPIGDIRGLQETMTFVINVVPYRCDHYRIRLHGHGKVRLYSLAIGYESESDEYEYKN